MIVLVDMSTCVTIEGTRGMRHSKLGRGGDVKSLEVNNEFLSLFFFVEVVVC